MTLSQLYNVLVSTGLPVAYNAFPEEAATELPVITYNVAYTNNFAASNKVYAKIRHVDIHLYTATKDEVTEQKLEEALNGASLFWEYNESFSNDERVFHLIYEVEING